MPIQDDATRRAARERSQARVDRYGGYASYPSTDNYGRARQDSDHLSQSRYERQTPRGENIRARDREYAMPEARQGDRRERRQTSDQRYRSGRSAAPDAVRQRERGRDGAARRPDRSGRDSGRQNRPRQDGRRRQPPQSQRQKSPEVIFDLKGLLDRIGSYAVPIGIGVFVLVVLLALVFGVIVPSCSKTEEPAKPVEVQTTSQQGLVHMVVQAKVAKQTEVQTANQVGALETSNSTIEALVELLGEEEAAKLLAQAKTNPDALWIAAHPNAYAFDGIEIQYKILKLAADEPAAIPYVREFPAKYPMNEAVADSELAMDVASPSPNVKTTSIPHLYQWDRRWAYTVYSSASFGLTGCGPTSLAMIYQGLNKTVDRTPHDIAVLAEERGYMSEFNGTDSAFFIDIAGELGLNCWEAYPDAANITDELSRGHAIIANLGPGYFTTNGHFFVLAGLTDDGQVIVNDPYSVLRSSQAWDAEFIATETIAMFVYSKA